MDQAIDVRGIIEKSLPGDHEMGELDLQIVGMRAHGMSIPSIAKFLKVAPSIVQKSVDSPGFESVVTIVRGNIDTWHRKQLSTVANMAWVKIIDALSEDLKIGDKGYAEQLKLAESLAKKAIDSPVINTVEVSEEEVTLNVSASSVDLIARRVHDLQSGSSESRTRDRKNERFAIDNLPPVIACHPKTSYGVMKRGENGFYLCHVCGVEHELFFAHIESVHRMTHGAYGSVFGIESELFSVESERV